MQTVDAPWTGIIFLSEDITYPHNTCEENHCTGEPLRDDKLTSFPCLTRLKKNCQVSLFAQQRKKQILFLFFFLLGISSCYFFFLMKTSDFLGRNQKLKEKQKNNLRLRETCGRGGIKSSYEDYYQSSSIIFL